MEQYTIYCTKGQTNKALELGAPIEVDFQFNYKTVIINKKAYIVPTAEQMIGWLEEQGIGITITKVMSGDLFQYMAHVTDIQFRYLGMYGTFYNSRQEATLAAIDAALEYLSKNNEL